MANGFTISGVVQLEVTSVTAAIALPLTGSPPTALITNFGEKTAFVALGGSTVTVTPATGLAVLPMASVALAIGSNTYLAAVTMAGETGLNVATGT